VLLSGNHAAIERWRRDRALALTAERRPDLVARAEAEGRLSTADREALARARAPKL
jgi:tRNA (guanine37-N1)-methyltransferase